MGSSFVGATKNLGIPARDLIQDTKVLYKWVDRLCSWNEVDLRSFIKHANVQKHFSGIFAGRESALSDILQRK
jgi:hypothetical protein